MSENPGGGAVAEPGLGSSKPGIASKSGVFGGGRRVKSGNRRFHKLNINKLTIKKLNICKLNHQNIVIN